MNNSLYHRTPPEKIEAWARDFEVKHLSASLLATHFEFCERILEIDLHAEDKHPHSLKLRSGAAALGMKTVSAARMYRDGRRSMSETFLPLAISEGARLVPNTRASRLKKKGGGWVALTSAGEVEAQSVFVCGGAVRSPALLRESGIRRNIGESMGLHPVARVVAEFDEEISDVANRAPAGEQLRNPDPAFVLGCSITTRQHLAVALLDHPDAFSRLPTAWRRMAIFYAQAESAGHGCIRRLPFFRDPLLRYELSASDVRTIETGLETLREILRKAGARALYVPKGAASGNLAAVHLFATCPMGEDRKICGVDSFGAVHENPGLFVSDASLLPSSPGVNPQGTIMAIARRNALHFLGKL